MKSITSPTVLSRQCQCNLGIKTTHCCQLLWFCTSHCSYQGILNANVFHWGSPTAQSSELQRTEPHTTPMFNNEAAVGVGGGIAVGLRTFIGSVPFDVSALVVLSGCLVLMTGLPWLMASIIRTNKSTRPSRTCFDPLNNSM